MRVARDGVLLTLIGGEIAAGRQTVRILRLSDGARALAYAIDEVRDIIDLTAPVTPATKPGLVAGVTLIDGNQIELLDPHWLFAEADAAPAAAELIRPVCLLSGDGGSWAREILRPLVEANGYQVVFDGEQAAGSVALVIACDAPEPDGVECPVVRLRSQREAGGDAADGSIYRYDRPALVEALRGGIAREARG
jgi:two-component system chemotaxis sensor kinase CheA